METIQLLALGFDLTSQLPFIVISLVIMYFFFVAPQQKQKKAEKDFLATMKEGSKVITIGGFHGTIVAFQESCVLFQVEDGGQLLLERQAISIEATMKVYPPPVAKTKRAEADATAKKKK